MTAHERIDLLYALNALLSTYKAHKMPTTDLEARINEIIKAL